MDRTDPNRTLPPHERSPHCSDGCKHPPIRIPCEGGGFAGHNDGLIGAVCAMCGGWFPRTNEGVVPEHERDDVIAMIDRGDFG